MNNNTDLHDLGVAQLAAALRAKQVSAVEAAQHFLARAKAHQGLAAYLAIDEDVTLAQARAQDAALATGQAAPLAGLPIAHKDVFVTRDFPTTAASRMLAGYRSPFDATVVSKLADAGCVTLGKLNCDEFAMGGTNENSAIPAVGCDSVQPVRNPWDTSRVPGGSSGGSAVAVAARLAALSCAAAGIRESLPVYVAVCLEPWCGAVVERPAVRGSLSERVLLPSRQRLSGNHVRR